MSDWNSAEQHAQKAHEHFEAGEWDKALSELRRAVELNPFESDWHFGMGLTLDAMHRFGEAVQAFDHALRLRGEDVETMLHLGVDLIRSNQDQRAVEILQRVAQIDPQCEPAYCHRILAHAQLGQHDQAEVMFYMARQIVDECPLCFDHIAASLQMQGKFDRAIWCWRQVLRLDPHFPEVYGNLARAYWQRQQFDQARQFFIRQLREEPGDIQTRLQMGVLLVAMDRHDEAREKFRQVIELDPSVAAAHVQLGELALLAGKLDAAQAELDVAQQLDPDRPGISLRLAQLCQRRGDLEAARGHLRAELAHGGHSPEQALEIAQRFIEWAPQNAADLLSAMLEGPDHEKLALPHQAAGLLYRGAARMLAGDLRTGADDCRRSLRLAPGNVLAMGQLALAYIELGALARAHCFLHRALQLQPQDRSLRQLRGRLIRAALAARVRNAGATVLRLLLPWRWTR